MRKRYIGIACIFLGILVVFFPFFKEQREDYQQQKILEEWKKEFLALDREETTEQSERNEEPEETKHTVGILKIPAIGLEQPVLKGATEENLNVSLATIEPAVEPGEEGNIAIAGHNSRTYGRHFNRLKELGPGDEVIIETADETYVYQVTDCFVVEAGDVWVLEDTLEGAQITLVTCHYPESGKTQRLIVKGIQRKDKGGNK